MSATIRKASVKNSAVIKKVKVTRDAKSTDHAEKVVLQVELVGAKRQCFGSTILNDVFDFAKKCKTCARKTPETAEACIVKTNPKIETASAVGIVVRINSEDCKKFAEVAQHRITGKRGSKNEWGHHEGTIGSMIDSLIAEGTHTKKDIESLAGTKMSKVNSHIAHLRKDKEAIVIAPRGGVVSFGEAEA